LSESCSQNENVPKFSLLNNWQHWCRRQARFQPKKQRVPPAPAFRASARQRHARGNMIRSSFAVAIGATLAASLSAAPPAFGQEETDQRLGTVHFATSCSETAQRRFDRGLRYQHSFWYTSSKEIFEDVLKADPACGIAYWGIALSLLNNPHGPPPAPNLPLGLAAIQKAKAVGAKTQRERDFIDALLVFYTDYDKIAHGTRV
jgi:hypothetical protein